MAPRQQETCASVFERLPDVLGGASRRDVDPPSSVVAAWGDPAIVLRCGVAPPEALASECIGVDGIDWVPEQRGDGYVFLTYGRRPPVEVSVPAAYAPEVNPLVGLADALSVLPQDERCT